MYKFLFTLSLSLVLLSCTSHDDWQIAGETYAFENITKNVYVIHGPLDEPNELNEGFMNNPGLVVGKNSLVVIDPGGSYQAGKKVLKEIEKISTLPIKAVFNTHIHGDHWLANHAIAEKYPDVVIYAHPEMIEKAKNGDGENWVDLMQRLTKGKTQGTIATYPNAEIQNKDIITIDDMSFIVHKPTNTAHSDSDVIIEYSKGNAIFAGDNLFNSRLGQFDSTSSIMQNIQALEYLIELEVDVFIPGHGTSGDVSIVKYYLHYLKTILKAAQRAYADGLEGYEIKDNVVAQLKDYQSWQFFDTNVGKHLGKAILEAEVADF